MKAQVFKNRDLNSPQTKNTVLRYLYKSNINLKAKPEHITSLAELDDIRDRDYVICPRYSGVRSWIMFFKENNNYYAVNFPKHNQNRKDVLQIHPVEIAVYPDMYLGTVMEGIYYRDEHARYLVIDEVYTLAGESQLLRKKTDRLNNLANYFKTKLNINPQYCMFVCQYYTTDPIDLSQLYEKIRDEPRIQDIIFYPQTYGGKIHSYTIINTDRRDDIIRIAEFYMKKTTNPDVYRLLSITRREKIDLAYIPTIEISRRCANWFKSQKIDELRVRCREDTEKRKWIPYEIVEENGETEDSEGS